MQTIGPPEHRRAALRAPGTLLVVYLSLVVTLALPAAAGDIDSEALFPLPLSVDLPAARVQLGERLFGDPRLSSNNALPCSGCHQLAQGGDDGRVRSINNSGQPDNVNTPTVFNSAFDFRHSRHGRFRTLKQQVEDDLHNPAHANTSWEELLPKLRADPDYVAGFSAVYAQGISRERVLDAVATLAQAVRVMGRVQLGVDIPDPDVVSIVAFLATLTGEYRGRSLADSGTGTP